MSKVCWLDVESFSECDLFKCGTFAYAEHASTEIIVAQWAINDGEPVVEDLTDKAFPSAALLTHLADPGITIVSHNAAFERAMLSYVWGLDVPIERWMCTMAKAMAHGLPGALGKVGTILGLADDQAKDKRGRELIQLFCKLRPKNSKLRRATRATHPTEWAQFLEYSHRDVIAMRAIDQGLPSWNYKPGHAELALWRLDQEINTRGVQVDLQLVDGAITAVQREQIRLKAEVVEATDGGVTNVSRRDQLLAYILAEYGVTLPDMKKDTLERRLNDPDLPDGVRFLIALRLEATKASTAKYVAFRRATNTDGRLRNTLQFCGAQRTGRWAGRLVQLQNLPRPDLKASDIAIGIDALRTGVAHLFDADVMRLSANAIRGAIIAAPGKKLCIADLANIEGRALAYLADERWKLKGFADYDAKIGQDAYVLAYARAFNVSPSVVLHDKEFGNGMMRQIGKVMELGLGFGGGVAAFITFAAVYKMDLQIMADAVWATASHDALENARGMLAWVKKNKRATFGLTDHVYIACEVLKRAWRDAHPNTESFWNACGEGVQRAIWNPGQTYRIGKHLAARVDGAWLRLRLPSGRYLCYTQPRVSDSGEISYVGVDQYTRSWKRVKTYPGKLAENATQAFARDVLAHNMPDINAAGYLIATSVHDELITETPDNEDFSSNDLAAMMSRVPSWASGLPVAAEGFESKRYRK